GRWHGRTVRRQAVGRRTRVGMRRRRVSAVLPLVVLPSYCSIVVLLPRPPIPVSRLHLLHHPLERHLEIDLLPVGHADDDEQDVGHLHGQVAFAFARLLGLLAEPVIHLARQLTHFLAEPRDVGERVEIALLILAHPCIHPPLG